MDVDALRALGVGRRRADGRSSATKRSLLAVSRSLEALASQVQEGGERFAVVALFEDVSYFDFEWDRYARLAASGTVVVGFAGVTDPAEVRLPAGVHHLPLQEEDPLSDEWSVLVLADPVCAGLVATDLRAVVAAGSLERGRLFSPAVGTGPRWTLEQARRVLAGADAGLTERVLAPGRACLARQATRGEEILREELEAGWWRTLTLARQLEGAERLALTDALAGPRDRRFLDHYLDRVGSRAPEVTAVLFDLDGFQRVNDDFGASVGDAALRAFVEVVRAHVRDTDLLVRTGADEWMLLLPATPREVAVTRTETILAAWATHRLPQPADGLVLAASAGLGVFRPDRLDMEAVEAALFSARATGGGRLTVLPGSPPPGD